MTELPIGPYYQGCKWAPAHAYSAQLSLWDSTVLLVRARPTITAALVKAQVPSAGMKNASTALAEGDPMLAALWDQAALLQFFQGRFPEAEVNARRSLAAARQLPEEDGKLPAVAMCQLRLGTILLGRPFALNLNPISLHLTILVSRHLHCFNAASLEPPLLRVCTLQSAINVCLVT